MKTLVGNIVVWLSAVVMIYYGGSKIGDPEWLGRIGVTLGWAGVDSVLATWLPWLEVGLGFLLISDGKVGSGARRCTAALLFAFLPFLLYFLLSGMTDCGCGGEGGGGVLSHPAFGIVRNLFLGAGLLWANTLNVWPFSSFDRRCPPGHNPCG
jgi:hypothetical protein